MQLTAPQVQRFYALWMPLLLFVNRRLHLVPEMLSADFKGPWEVPHVAKVRDALWADDSLLQAFLAENRDRLSAADVALIESWRHRQAGSFYVLRHLKSYTIFIGERRSDVYAVLGLTSPLEDVVHFVPGYVQAVLLPFEGKITYDSVLTQRNITFGGGIRRSLENAYKDAKERGALIASLVPAGPPTREEELAAAQCTNAKVLAAFRTHQYKSGRGPKVVERDVGHATAFAEASLRAGAEGCSLREVRADDVLEFVSPARMAGLKEKEQRERLTAMKRFVRFMRDTERMSYGEDAHFFEMLKGEN